MVPFEFGSSPRSMISLVAVVLIAASVTVSAAGVGRAATMPDSLWSPAERDSLQRVQALVQGGRYGDAQTSARAMLAELRKTRGEHSLQSAMVIDQLVLALFGAGQAADPRTRELAERAVQVKEGVLGPEHPAVAVSLNQLGLLFRRTGNYSSAIPLHRRAVSIQEKALGPDHPDVARSLHGLALALYTVGDHAGARPLYERVLAIQEAALGPDHLDRVPPLLGLAGLLYVMGDYAGARPLYERALAIQQKNTGPEHPLVAAVLQNLALLMRTDGDLAGARSYYERSLAIRERMLGPHHPDVAANLIPLADVLLLAGEYRAPRPLYERALAIQEKALGPDHPDVGASLINFANLLGETGDDVGARHSYERALAILEGSLGKEHLNLAACLNSLANLLSRTDDLAGARSNYERALAIREKALGPDHPDVAWSLGNLATLLTRAGDHAGAWPLAERALAIRTRVLGPDHGDVAWSLDDLAALHFIAGDFAQARALYERALAIHEQVLGPDHPRVARSLGNLARLLQAQGQGSEAARLALRAEAISRESFRATARALPERQALALSGARSNGLVTALSLIEGLADPDARWEVLDALVRSRALVLDEMAARHRSLGASDDAETGLLATSHRAAIARYAHLLVRGPDAQSPERYRSSLERSRREMEEAERRLSARSAQYREERRDLEVGIDEVAAALPRRSALIAFATYPRRQPGSDRSDQASYLAWVLRGGTHRAEAVPVGAAAAIDSLIAAWSNEAGRNASLRPGAWGEAAYRRAGRALRQSLWDPLTPHLREIDRVFVVPDGAVSLVSLATLPLDSGQYLLENGPLFHYLSAERDLVRPASGLRGRGLLAVGGLGFDERTSVAPDPDEAPTLERASRADTTGGFRGSRSRCSDFAALRFDSLPGTLHEAREVMELWRQGKDRRAQLLTGAQASEEAIQRHSPGQAVLHLATHGFFITGHCPSALDRTRPETDRRFGGPETVPSALVGENPLLLSGLALAGANRRSEARPAEDDGILTAEEVASMNLTGVDWAVLSACETGTGGVLSGEGVLGLRRAFQVAGARTVIMSLWAVEDESTRRWMRALYRARLKRGLGTAEAVRAAGLEMLREQRKRGLSTHPFRWGAFIAAGDWR